MTGRMGKGMSGEERGEMVEKREKEASGSLGGSMTGLRRGRGRVVRKGGNGVKNEKEGEGRFGGNMTGRMG